MIVWLTLALASPPELTGEPTEAWTTEAFDAVTFNSADCTLESHGRGNLPAGTPVMAHWLHEEACGQQAVRVRLPFNTEGGRSYITPGEGITTRPPRRPTQADTDETAFIRSSSSRLARGLALGPDRVQAHFPDGMPVTLVDADVGTFADATGQVWLAQDNGLTLDPPVHRGGNRRVFDKRQVLATEWQRHSDPVIGSVPAAEALGQAETDAVFLVRVRREDMTPQRAFSPDWVDPIGQVVEHTCDAPPSATEFTPCGRYWLDYRAFGALWFEGGSDLLLVRYTGSERRDGESLPTLRIIGMDIPSTPVLSTEW